jgi:hypothetical protein
MPSKFTASGVSLVNTSGTVVAYQSPNYNNPSGCSIVISALVGNGTPGDVITTLNVQQGTGFVSHIIRGVVVPSGASLETIPNKVILTSGQSLNMTAAISGSITSTISVLEIF